MTLADIEAAREVIDRGRAPNPDGGRPLALRPGRRTGEPEVREPPAHRLLQDPRCLPPHLPALRGGAGRRASSPPVRATMPRGWRWQPPRSASARPSSCPRGRRSPRRRRRVRTAPTSASTAATSRTRWSRRRKFAAETGAVLIHPFDHADVVAGQGTRRAGDPRAAAGREDRDRADRRRRPACRASPSRSRPRAPMSA